MEGGALDIVRETGSLGLLALVLWWLLKRLNGKLDNLAVAMRELAGAMKELRDHFERSR